MPAAPAPERSRDAIGRLHAEWGPKRSSVKLKIDCLHQTWCLLVCLLHTDINKKQDSEVIHQLWWPRVQLFPLPLLLIAGDYGQGLFRGGADRPDRPLQGGRVVKYLNHYQQMKPFRLVTVIVAYSHVIMLPSRGFGWCAVAAF